MRRSLLRLVPRYSLRTLAVFMLLCTSGVGLWYAFRREPWVLAHELECRQYFATTFSPDSRFAVTGDDDGNVILWDVVTGERAATFETGLGPVVTWVKFSPDGGRMLTVGHSRSLVWDLGTRQVVGEIPHGGFETAGFLGSGCTVLVGRHIWSADDLGLVMDLEGAVLGLGEWLSSDGARGIVIDSSDHARVVEMGTGKVLRRLGPHKGNLTQACISPGGDLALTFHSEKTANHAAVWNTLTGEKKFTITGTSRLWCAQFSVDGSELFLGILGNTGYGDSTLSVHESRTGELLREMNGLLMALAPDGRRALFVGRVVDLRTGRSLGTVPIGGTYYYAQFSPDGNYLIDAPQWVPWRSEPGYEDHCGLFHRRRPEWWWGVFYLWEFWLTAALAAIFVWSVVRDRRRLARTG